MRGGTFWSVALAVAWRVVHNVFTTPSLLLPGLIFPLFFFTAFAGGLSRVDNIPGFDYDPALLTQDESNTCPIDHHGNFKSSLPQ